MSVLLSPKTVVLASSRPPELVLTPSGTIVPSYLYKPHVTLEVDDEHHNNYKTQKQMTEWLRLRILDKWLYHEDMSDALKYLKISGGNVSVVKSEQEMNENDIEKDTEDVVDKKVKFIEDEHLSVDTMRAILWKIIEELNYKWYNLASHEKVIVKAVARHLRANLKKIMDKKN
jgi:hypothetical protein